MEEMEESETCEDREYRCCETLTRAEHIERYGYPGEGLSWDPKDGTQVGRE